MNVILPTIPTKFKESTTAVSNIGYSFNKESLGRKPGNSSLNNSGTSIINSYFAAVTSDNSTKKEQVNTNFIISKPTFSHTNSKVTIQLFYYIPCFPCFPPGNKGNKTKSETFFTESSSTYKKEHEIFRKDLSVLSTTLAQLFQKEVNLVTVRLYYPYLNSSILSQYLTYNAVSNTFIDFQESILTNPSLHKTNLPGHISGIKVQVSGRLVTETVVPRVTVKSSLIGSFQTKWDDGANNSSPSDKKTMQFIDYSKFTSKNELGAFTVKVWICQRS